MTFWLFYLATGGSLEKGLCSTGPGHGDQDARRPFLTLQRSLFWEDSHVVA
jgi:hypothetical protein